MSLRANHLISCQWEHGWPPAAQTPANHSPLLSNIKLNQIILPIDALKESSPMYTNIIYKVFDNIGVELHSSSPHFSQLVGKRLTRVSSYGRHLNGRVLCLCK